MWYLALIPYKKQIAIGLAVLVVAIVIYFSVKTFLEPETEKVPLPEDNPNGVLSETEKAIVNNMAISLHDDMDGWFDSRDNDLYRSLSILSDKLLVAVYNVFNENYISEGDGTLRAWLKDESYTAFTGDLVKNTILPRMDKLGLV